MSKDNRIIVLLVQAGEKPKTLEIYNTLEAMQALVGGYIEMVTIDQDVSLVCNEEGKLKNLPPNRMVGGDIIAGHFFISRSNEDGEAVSLTSEDIEKYSKRFETTWAA